MMRRTGIAFMFALLGFISLLLADESHRWLCAHLPGFCKQSTTPCPGIDLCTPDTTNGIAIIAFYLGPAAVFAISGFLFSHRQRHLLAWLAVPIGLVVAHALIVIVVMQASTQ